MKRALLLSLAVCALPALLGATPPGGPFDRFVGVWNCTAVRGSAGQMTFTRTRAGLALHIDWKDGGGQSFIDHVFTLNPDGSWATTETNAAKTSTFKGNSPGFDGDTIAFTGAVYVGNQSYPQLEKFRLTSSDALQHIWYGQSNAGQWQPNGYQECTKVST